MTNNLGNKLKELRKKNNLTAEEVSLKLRESGYDIAGKTLSGYENGIRMPNADVFMALMSVYNCKNILESFSFVEADYSIPSDEEWNIIEKYRFLDPFGQETVSYILDREYERTKQLETAAELSPLATRIIPYYQRLASAGTGQVLFDGVPIDRIEIPDIPEYKKVSYAIGVNGDSMEPLYYDDDVLLIEPTCSVDIGEIGIFNVDGKAFVKKLGEKELISINKKSGNISLTKDSKCMGRVVDKLTI